MVRRLGRGGMGVVDLAVAEDGSQVALKRLPLHGSAEEIGKARARIRREADVLRCLAEGQSTTEIATSLFISPATVKCHVARLIAKVGVRDRLQLVIAAYRSGFVTVD